MYEGNLCVPRILHKPAAVWKLA